MIEVIVPALRTPQELIESLSRGSLRPDLVTIVSNESDLVFDEFGLDVRVMRFTSDTLCYGDRDVVLRRNIGIWKAKGDLLVFQDDDQIASHGMIEESARLLERMPIFWGHHRYIDFSGHDVATIMAREPWDGLARENGVNRVHGHWSAYAGMFGTRLDYMLELGGFDMAFMGRHAGEDQQLGLRHMHRSGEKGIFIHEPPFAWHPTHNAPRRPAKTNSCGDHDLDDDGTVKQCSRCPYYRIDGQWEYLARRFDPSEVEVIAT